MAQVLRWIATAIAIVLAVLAVLFCGYRIRGPSAEQSAALALLLQDRHPPPGRNAFTLFWYMGYEVADADADELMAADIEQVKQRLASGGTAIQYAPSAATLAQPRFDEPGLCGGGDNDCLERVAASPDTTRSMLDEFARPLARAQSLAGYTHLWTDFPPDYRAPMGMFAPALQSLALTSLALRFVDGDRAGALGGLCRNVASWRRLRAATNSLIGDMVSIHYADRGMRLFAEMLAAAPTGEPVPSDCIAAFRPVEAADVDRCAELARELAINENTLQMSAALPQASWDRFLSWLSFDRVQTVALQAEQFAHYCGQSATQRLLEDRPIAVSAVLHPVRQLRLECIANATGCVLSEISSAAYVAYDERLLDYAAHLRLAATLVWLARAPAGDGALHDRFEQRPEALRSAGHASAIDANQLVLFVENIGQNREKRFELAVPAALATARRH
jgi:hypothetical protein